MLNLFGFMIVTVISLIRIKSGLASNPLLNIGTMILCGYLLSLSCARFGISAAVGYVLAGILIGENGLGLIDDLLPEHLVFFENIALMVALAAAVQVMCSGASVKGFLRQMGTGAIIAVMNSVAVIMLLFPFNIPLPAKIAAGLFAGTLTPLGVYSFTAGSYNRPRLLRTALGGFITTIFLWGIAVSGMKEVSINTVRLALMPVIVGLSSLIAGFVWGYATEILLSRKMERIRTIHLIGSMVFIYPLIRPLGLDFMFLAIGIGFYYGLVSERDFTPLGLNHILMLFIFVVFGMRLSIEDIASLGISGWNMVFVITGSVLCARLAITAAVMRLSGGVWTVETAAFIIFGPLAIPLLRRFLPGFREHTGDLLSMDTLFTTFSVIVIAAVFCSLILSVIHTFLVAQKSQKKQAGENGL